MKISFYTAGPSQSESDVHVGDAVWDKLPRINEGVIGFGYSWRVTGVIHVLAEWQVVVTLDKLEEAP